MTDFFDAKGIVFQPSSNGNYTGRDAKGIEFKFNPSSGGFDVTTYGAVGDGTTDDTTAIQNAINAANTAGGGTVLFAAKTYKISSALTLKPNVWLKGQGWHWSGSVVDGGTLFTGGGSNDCLTYNSTALGAQPSIGTVTGAEGSGGCIKNLLIEGIAFTNFANAIHIGDLMNPGCFYSTFRNIFAYGCTSWGFYFENCSLCQFENLTVYNMSAGAVGNMFFGASNSAYNHGNSKFAYLYGSNSNLTYGQRGIVFMARTGAAAGAAFNDLNVFHIQNSQGATGNITSQAATMAGASATIGVTDGTKFPKDMPVSVDATQNGFTKFFTYFVIKNGVADGLLANQIQVSTQQRGTAVSATNNAAVNIISFGYPCIEIVGQADNASNAIQASSFYGIDAEGKASCNLFTQNAAFTYLGIGTIYNGQGITNGDQNFSSYCSRNSTGNWTGSNAMTVDIKNTGTPALFCLGANILSDSYPTTAILQDPLHGFYYDRGTSVNVFNINSRVFNSIYNSFQSQNENTGGCFIYPNTAFGQKITHSNSTSLSLWTPYSGLSLYTGAGAATWTLPTLHGGEGGLSTNSAGMVFEICNTGSGTLTLSRGGTDTFKYPGSATTTYALTQGQSITVRAAYDGTNPYWAVLAAVGVTP